MRNLFILICILSIISCKKNKNNNLAFTLNETNWNLFFKTNTTFDFYAKSSLYFRQDNTVDNYRNFDTLSSTWTLDANTVAFNFSNGEKYIGTVITIDSIAGTLTSSGNNGVWYAIRK